MLDLQQRVKSHFNDSIQLHIDCADSITDDIIHAADNMVSCLLGGNKILCCGNGTAAGLAQLFSANMLNFFGVERPSLPTIAITSNTSMLTALANQQQTEQMYAKQIKGLGHANDILLAISDDGQCSNLQHAIQAAHQRHMHVVVLSGGDYDNKLNQLLDQHDLHICIPSDSSARTQETHLLILHCLCDIIEQQLFSS